MWSVASNSLKSFGLSPTRLLCSWDFSGKNTRVGCHFLLQGIFPTQGSNPHLLHCRRILYPLIHLETKQYKMYFNLKIDMFNCRVWLLNCQTWLKMAFKFAKTYRSNCPALKNSIILLYICLVFFFLAVCIHFILKNSRDYTELFKACPYLVIFQTHIKCFD